MSSQERQEKVFKLNNILSKLSNRSVTPCDADDASKLQSKGSKAFPANQINVETSDNESGSESFVRPTRLIPRTGLEDRLSLTRNLCALRMPVVVQSRHETNTEEWNEFESVTSMNYSNSSPHTLLGHSGPQARSEDDYFPGMHNLEDTNTVDGRKSVLDAYLYQDKDCNATDAAWSYNFGIHPRDTCIVVQPSESIGIICEVCKRSFESKKALKRHCKETHKNVLTLKTSGRNKLGVSLGKTLKGNSSVDSQLGNQSSSDSGAVESYDGSAKMAEKQNKIGSKAKGDKQSRLTQGDMEATTGKNNPKAVSDDAKTGKGKVGMAKNEAAKTDKKLKMVKLTKAAIKIVGRKGITISGKASSLSKVAYKEKKKAALEKDSGKSSSSTLKRPEVKAKILTGKNLSQTVKLSKKAQAERDNDKQGKGILVGEQGNVKNHILSGKEKIAKNVVEKSYKEQVATGKHYKGTADPSIEKKKMPKIDDKLQKLIDEPYKCQECGMGFRNKTNLSKHTPIHLMMKYHCYRCNDVFLNMRSLTKHLALHEYEPPINDHMYRCRMCSQGFKTSRQLRRHMTDHERMEGLVDALAAKKGSTNKDLSSPQVEKKSVDEHRKDIDVKCGPCQQTFENYFKFKEHVLNKHIALGDLSLQCSKCNDIFTSDVEVAKHLVAAHKLNRREARATVRQKEADAVFLGLRASILECPKEGEKAAILEQRCDDLKTSLDVESPGTLNREASHSSQKDAEMLDTHGQSKVFSNDNCIESKPIVGGSDKGGENDIVEKHSGSAETDTADKEFISENDGESKSCFLEEQESRNILQALFIEVDGELCETGPTEASSLGSNGENLDQKGKDSSLTNSSIADTPLAKMKQTLISAGPSIRQEDKRATPAVRVGLPAKDTSSYSNDNTEQKMQNQASDSMLLYHTDNVKKPSSCDLYKPLSKQITTPQPKEVSVSSNAIDVNVDPNEKCKELIKGNIADNMTSIIGLPDVCIDDDDDDDDVMWFWKNDENEGSTNTPREIETNGPSKLSSNEATSHEDLAEGTDDGKVGETWLEDRLQLQGDRYSHKDTIENVSDSNVSGVSESVVRGAERYDMYIDEIKQKRAIRQKRDYRGKFSCIKAGTRRGRLNQRGSVESCWSSTETVERKELLDTQSKDDLSGPSSDVVEMLMQPNSNTKSESCESFVQQEQRYVNTCVKDGESDTKLERHESKTFTKSFDASNNIAAGDELREPNIDSVKTVSNIIDANSESEVVGSMSQEGENSSQISLHDSTCDENPKKECGANCSDSIDTSEVEANANVKSAVVPQEPKIDTCNNILKGSDSDFLLKSILKDGELEMGGERTEKDGERPVCACVSDSESVTELGNYDGGKVTKNYDETNAANKTDIVDLKANVAVREIRTVRCDKSAMSESVESMVKELERPGKVCMKDCDGNAISERDDLVVLHNVDRTDMGHEHTSVKLRRDLQKLKVDTVEYDAEGNDVDESKLTDSCVREGKISEKISAKEDESDARLGGDSSGIFSSVNGIIPGKDSTKVQSLAVPQKPIHAVENSLKENADDVSEHVESCVPDREWFGQTAVNDGCTRTESKRGETETILNSGETPTRGGSNEAKLGANTSTRGGSNEAKLGAETPTRGGSNEAKLGAETSTRGGYNEAKLGAELNLHELDATENISTKDLIQMSDFDRSIDREAEETNLNDVSCEADHSNHKCYSSREAAERNGISKAISVANQSEPVINKKRKFTDTSMVDQGEFLPFVRRKASISGEKRISESIHQRKSQTAHTGSHRIENIDPLSFNKLESRDLKEMEPHSMSECDQVGLPESATLVRETVDETITTKCETLTANQSNVACSSMNVYPTKTDERISSAEPSLKMKAKKRGRPPSKRKTKRKRMLGVQRGPIDIPNSQINSVVGFATKNNDAERCPVDVAAVSLESDTGAFLIGGVCSNIPGAVSNLSEKHDGQLSIDSADEHTTTVTTELSLPAKTSSNENPVCMSKDALTQGNYVHENDTGLNINVDVTDASFKNIDQKRVKRTSIARKRAFDASLIQEQGDLSSLIYVRRHAAVVGEEKIHGSAHRNKRHLSNEESVKGGGTEDANDDRPPLDFADIERKNKLKKGKDGEPCFTHVKNKGQIDGFENASNWKGKSGYLPLNHKLDGKDRDSFPNLNSRSQFKCKSCGECLTEKSRLITHLREHERDFPSVDKEPTTELKQSDQIGKLKCDLCSKSFNTAYFLGLHKKRHKEPDLDKSIEDEHRDKLLFQCAVCEKSFLAKRSLTRHLKGHKERTAMEKQHINNSLDRHIKKPERTSKLNTSKQRGEHGSKK